MRAKLNLDHRYYIIHEISDVYNTHYVIIPKSGKNTIKKFNSLYTLDTVYLPKDLAEIECIKFTTVKDYITPYPNKAKNRLCIYFLNDCERFKWFIVKWFGPDRYLNLIHLAAIDDHATLQNDLDYILYKLPDHISSVKENLLGWVKFLNLLDD